MASGWDRIYRQRGDLGYAVLPKVVRAARIFQQRGYRDVLDLGCGTGKHAVFLAEKGFSVQATDLSPAGLEIAERKARSLGLDNVRFSQHDMKVVPFPNESFDAVICTWTIYHGTVKNIQDALAEIHRVLRPRGILITDFLSVKDSTFGRGAETEKNTFIGQKPDEEDVPHHYCTRSEVFRLLGQFDYVRVRLSSKTVVDEAGKEYARKYFDVWAERPFSR